MKKSILILATAGVFALGTMLISGCVSTEEQHKDEAQEHASEEAGEEITVQVCPRWKYGKGPHVHATYVCPRWCKHGESEKQGECGSCGKKLVKFANVKAKHNAQKPE